ncbi:MAG TPA: hypothetical protein EYQ42_09275, partial [Thiotrichaceae bacterium]|nr:hypothetical protein [Thiotrichaceae bacterium]
MKKQNITLSFALAAIFSSSVAFAEAEVTGKIVHESAVFTQGGIGIGGATTATQTADSHGQDIFKMATHAKVFIDGDVSDSTYHVELNVFKDLDSDAVGDNDSNESYTQRDALREAYVDSEVGDFSIRAGKQQVVWGTADGMKLLDAINPTDYSEMAQNQMEDSRIPVWMVNAETDLATGGSLQFILAESRSHNIAGIGEASAKGTSHTNGDSGHPFIMKGVDSVTGKVNGFMNVAPALGQVADFFATYGGGAAALRTYTTARVADYINDNKYRVTLGTGSTGEANFRGTCNDNGDGNASYCQASDMNYVSQNNSAAVDHVGVGDIGKNNDVTNIIDSTNTSSANWDVVNPNSAFEYMDQAAFATFAAFQEMTSEYRVKDESGENVGFRVKNSLENGLNYSLNYLYGNDPNPHIDLHWEDSSDGTKLYACEDNATRAALTSGNIDVGGTTQAATTVTRMRLFKTADCSTTMHQFENDGAANIVFVQKRNKIHNIGGSFDTAIETKALGPVVFRGEGLYQKDVKSQTINLAKLKIGNFTEAFKAEKTDYLKYVLGVDITRLTNMMVSAQFIQIRNLDYIDETVNANASNTDVTGARYHADQTVMHMSNGFKKAEKNKEFYSFFLSKPFGASGEHRWNNITMFEENGGLWNRLDAEFSIDDDTQATVEYNKYWGDEDTQFGQLAKSSNIQIGF